MASLESIKYFENLEEAMLKWLKVAKKQLVSLWPSRLSKSTIFHN